MSANAGLRPNAVPATPPRGFKWHGEALPGMLGLPVLRDACEPPRPVYGCWETGKYKDLLRRRNPACFYCGTVIERGRSTIDHVIPRSKGGLDVPANMVLACPTCNGLKRAMLPGELLTMLNRMVDAVRALVTADMVTG